MLPLIVAAGVHVVAHDHHRPARCRGPSTSVPRGTISPEALRTLSCSTSSRRAAEAGVGLDVDLPGAAELVEVVDVERAHVDLQGVEDVVERSRPSTWP